MDWTTLKAHGNRLFSKYKYVVLVILAGVVLMAIPSESSEVSSNPVVTDQPQPESYSEALEQILCQIEGVGRVQVLLTEQSGAETIYQTDEDRSSDGSVRVETVIISDDSRAQRGLVREVIPASYQGAIVVCQGADNPSVRLAVTEAVANVTGLGTDRIAVLKMK